METATIVDPEFELEVEEADQCRLCLGRHEETLHAATSRIRDWLRAEVNRKISYGNPASPEPVALQAA